MTDFPSVELHSFPELFKYKKKYIIVFLLYVYKFRERKERDKNQKLQVNLFHSIFS